MTPAEMIAYYQGLLIIQYFGLPKARATIGVQVAEVVADNIVLQVEDGFNTDTAVGKQLDIVADYVGAKRAYFGLTLDREYFEMPGYADPDPQNANGFMTYTDPAAVTWLFLSYTLNPLYTLTDPELRKFIKFKADVNGLFISDKTIDDLLFKYFGNGVAMTDNFDMTMNYTAQPGYESNTLFLVSKISGSFPSPAGVQVTVS